MRQLIFAIAAVVLPLQGSAMGQLRTDPPPNVIIIFTDDQGYQDVGCFGSPDIATPHLDQMAKEGMRTPVLRSAHRRAPDC